MTSIGASVQLTTLQTFPSTTPLHFPSDPVLKAHIISFPVRVEHAPNGLFTQPYPVVTQPIWYSVQALSEIYEDSASVQILAEHLVPSRVP